MEALYVVMHVRKPDLKEQAVLAGVRIPLLGHCQGGRERERERHRERHTQKERSRGRGNK